MHILLSVFQPLHGRHSIAGPLLPAGYVLDPEYMSHDVMGIPEVAQGFLRYAKRMLPDEPMTNLAQKLDAELKKFRCGPLTLSSGAQLCCFNKAVRLPAGKSVGCSAMVTMLCHLGSSGTCLEQRHRHYASWPSVC